MVIHFSIAIFRTGRDYIHIYIYVDKKNVERLINCLIY